MVRHQEIQKITSNRVDQNAVSNRRTAIRSNRTEPHDDPPKCGAKKLFRKSCKTATNPV